MLSRLGPALGRAALLPARRAAAHAPRAFHLRGGVAFASIVDDVSTQMKEAMRSKDSVKLNSLRNMRAAFLVAQKETGADTLPDDKAVEVLRKLTKQRAESIAAFRAGGREDAAAAEEAEMRLMEAFLPALADEAQTEAWAREAIAAVKATKPAEAGKVIGAVVKAHKGEVDTTLVKTIVERLLKVA